jgi:myo-inositol-1-phosphate synthase
MLNLTTKKTLDAKMRVKSDIFGPWQEKDLDHKVCVMFCPYIGDEKRDFVEYTSLGFLGSPHTMVTYTRCMDSILCVPLMVDAAIWCDYFVNHNVSAGDAARATAYLFKVPEGEAKGVDPGFFNQMKQLEDVLEKTVSKRMNACDMLALGVSRGIITDKQASALQDLT